MAAWRFTWILARFGIVAQQGNATATANVWEKP
jgi:hypothetical protein